MNITRLDVVCTRHNKPLVDADYGDREVGILRFRQVEPGHSVFEVDFEQLDCPDWREGVDECQDDWQAQSIAD